jgi:hypothetical protein
MDMHTSTRRGVAIVVAAMAGAAGLFVALPASAQSNDGEVVPGNPGCDDIAPEGEIWIELKVEPPADGEFSDDTLTVNVDVRDTEDGQVFDWDSNIGVDAVIVKGGPDANVYLYDPESMGATGLHAPVSPSGQWAGLSHISFCYDEDDVPPPPTPTPTPTPTSPTTAPTPPTTAPPVKPAPPARPVVAQPTFTG